MIIEVGVDFGFDLRCAALIASEVGALICEDATVAVSETAEALASGDLAARVVTTGVPEADISVFVVLVGGRGPVGTAFGEDCGGGEATGFGGGPVMRQPGGGV